MTEDLSARTYGLYADAEERLLGIVARQLAAGFEAPGWAQRKLVAIQPLRRAARAVVDELGRAVELEVFDVVAESYSRGHRAAVAELGALADDERRLVDEVAPNAQAVDRLAVEAVQLVTATHRGILRAVVDAYRDVVARVTATPLLGTGTRRQAVQDAMRDFADRGISGFTDRAGRRWQLTSYAEMAVRTSTARAAVEAHTRTLTEAGVEYVIVSDAPRECPLCRPWEGRLLSIGGPDGRRTVELEHATRDGEFLSLVVQGSLDEARRAGFQHPNCRHSISAYIPGVTSLVPPTRADGSSYEAGQRQRAIERNIRKHKKRAAAAPTPEAKKAAEAKVRRWQKTMREHLTTHPNLRRLRHREKLGAGNLPPARADAPSEVVEAARLRAGDARTPQEMSEQQVAEAIGTGILDDRDLDRAAGELDRRDLAALLDRIRPGGQLVADLTPHGDDELARVLPHLDDSQVLTVAAELDRRDVAVRLPGVRADLIRLSEADLAHRVRNAGGPGEFAALAAEADRRQLLARLYPGGRLVDELGEFDDETLAWAVPYATAGEAERIAAEIDHRHPAGHVPKPAATGDAVADLLTDHRTTAEALAPVPDPDEWGWLALDEPDPRDRLSRTERWLADREDEQQAAHGAFTREQIRELYREHVHRQYLAAEEACRGYLLSRRAQTEGTDPESLFTGPAHVAYARASEDLKRYWAGHPRLTLAEFTDQLTGIRTAEAERARRARSEQDNRQ